MAENNSICCQSCGKEFIVPSYRRLTAKSCSIECAYSLRNGRAIRPAHERFWEKVAISGPDDCWEWQGATGGNSVAGVSYGSFHFEGQTSRANRVAYILHNGDIPDALHVRHRCDNPSCCNPAHLELGTHADNMRDMVIRGRASVSDETRQRISIAQTGKPLSVEHKAKLSIAAKARKGLNNARPVRIYGVEYPTVVSAARALGHNKSWMFDQLKKGVAEYVDQRKCGT